MNGNITPTTYPVAFGDSFYFDIHGINSRPTSLKVRYGMWCMGTR